MEGNVVVWKEEGTRARSHVYPRRCPRREPTGMVGMVLLELQLLPAVWLSAVGVLTPPL